MIIEAKVFLTKKNRYAGRVIAKTWEEAESKAGKKGEIVVGELVEVIPVECLKRRKF